MGGVLNRSARRRERVGRLGDPAVLDAGYRGVGGGGVHLKVLLSNGKIELFPFPALPSTTFFPTSVVLLCPRLRLVPNRQSDAGVWGASGDRDHGCDVAPLRCACRHTPFQTAHLPLGGSALARLWALGPLPAAGAPHSR